MALTPLDPTVGLTPGAQYTLSMNESGGILAALVVPPSALTVQQELVDDCSIDIATSISVQSFQETNGTGYDVTFIYSGDGTDSANDVFQEFANSLSGIITSWNYLGIVVGATGFAAANSVTTQVSTAASNAAAAINPLIPSSSSLWAIAIIAIVAVFVFSGGIGVVRGATSG
jgi:hypothetical protein